MGAGHFRKHHWSIDTVIANGASLELTVRWFSYPSSSLGRDAT